MAICELLDIADWFQSLHIAQIRSSFLHTPSSPLEVSHDPSCSIPACGEDYYTSKEAKWRVEQSLRHIGRHRFYRKFKRRYTGCSHCRILTSGRREGELKAWALSMSTHKAMLSHHQCCWLTRPTMWRLGILPFDLPAVQMATPIQLKKIAFSVQGRRSKTRLGRFSCHT